MTLCDRCGRETISTTMSYFNLQIICSHCDEKERAHPMFEAARAAELNAVYEGELNFPGIGLPPELKERR